MTYTTKSNNPNNLAYQKETFGKVIFLEDSNVLTFNSSLKLSIVGETTFSLSQSLQKEDVDIGFVRISIV